MSQSPHTDQSGNTKKEVLMRYLFLLSYKNCNRYFGVSSIFHIDDAFLIYLSVDLSSCL